MVLCLAVDRHTYARALELFAERQASERERQRADLVLANVLPAAVAAELKANGTVRPRKIPKLGVLFADIAGFTDYARRLPPDALVLVLDDIFTRFDALVQGHGVEKIKTIGDAYMAAAGLEAGSHIHFAAAVASMAFEMQDEVRAYCDRTGERIQLRIGIGTGPVVSGVIGRKKFIYDIWGDTVNVAFRMAADAAAGAIHVDLTTYRRLHNRFLFDEAHEVDIKGKGRMHVYHLQGRLQRDLPNAAG